MGKAIERVRNLDSDQLQAPSFVLIQLIVLNEIEGLVV